MDVKRTVGLVALLLILELFAIVTKDRLVGMPSVAVQVIRQEVFAEFPRILQGCDKKTNLSERLNLTSLQNDDETKWLRPPAITLLPSEECNVVTLGVGRDTKAEKQLIPLVSKTCRFTGADPIKETNEKLYREFGDFFEVAVGAKSGNYSALVLGFNNSWNYEFHNVTHVDLISFLKKSARVHSIVDYLLMDNEHAEYDLLAQFLPGAELDQSGIVVCQWLCEFHGTSDRSAAAMKLADFLIKNLIAGKFLPVHALHVGHIRTSFINTKDPECVRRYLPDFL